MVNDVLNKSTFQNITSAKAPQGASDGNIFQDLFSYLQKFDTNNSPATSNKNSFQIERTPVNERVEAPKPTREKESREVKGDDRSEDELKKTTERSRNAKAIRLEAERINAEKTALLNNNANAALDHEIAAVPQAEEKALKELPTTQKETPQTDVTVKNETTDVAVNDDSIKAQSTEIAAQSMTGDVAKKAEVQQGQTVVNVAAEAGAKRTVNLQQPSSVAAEKIDEKSFQMTEEGSGKQNFAGEEKESGGNQQKASTENALKLTNPPSTPQNPLINALKQPSFKETVNNAMKAEVKTGEAVGNQNSQDTQKTLETKLKTAADIERPKQAAKFAQSVGNSIRTMKFNPGKNEMTVRIDPPQLGKLKINVNLDQGKISTSIVAESQAVKSALESNMGLLRGTLEQSGLKLENLTVTVNDGSNEDANLKFGDKKNNNSQNGNSRNEKTAQGLDESEIEQYVNLSNYRAESKGVYFVSTTA